MGNVHWEAEALEQLRRISSRNRSDASRISEAIERFAETNIGDVKKLKGQPRGEWRLRVGRWRILFSWNGENMTILAVVPRRDAYD